jgi:hypothetical protein
MHKKSTSTNVLNRPIQPEKRSVYPEPRIDNSFHDQLARTYLKPARDKREVLLTRLLWLVTIIAIAAVSCVFIASSNIDIKVNVLNGRTPFITTGRVVDWIWGLWDKDIYFVKGGAPNRELTAKAFFVADARIYSRMTDDEDILCNAGDQGIATYVIELKKPMDLNGMDLKYTAKGEFGDERLIMVLVDSDSKAVRVEDDSAARLSKNWQVYTINFKPVKDLIDLSSIMAIRFEFGSSTAGNRPLATIALKNICVAQTKRVKWLQ